jgi:hypothetical protein
VVRLDPQSLFCVERPETFLQFVQDIFVHEITSFKNRLYLPWSMRLYQTLQIIFFGQTGLFIERHGSFAP